MTGAVVFDPLFGWAILAGLAAAVLAMVALALWSRMAGAWLRAFRWCLSKRRKNST